MKTVQILRVVLWKPCLNVLPLAKKGWQEFPFAKPIDALEAESRESKPSRRIYHNSSSMCRKVPAFLEERSEFVCRPIAFGYGAVAEGVLA
jgi:hypothetical protein